MLSQSMIEKRLIETIPKIPLITSRELLEENEPQYALPPRVLEDERIKIKPE